jgi:hypothetical protein
MKMDGMKTDGYLPGCCGTLPGNQEHKEKLLNEAFSTTNDPA